MVAVRGMVICEGEACTVFLFFKLQGGSIPLSYLNQPCPNNGSWKLSGRSRLKPLLDITGDFHLLEALLSGFICPSRSLYRKEIFAPGIQEVNYFLSLNSELVHMALPCQVMRPKIPGPRPCVAFLVRYILYDLGLYLVRVGHYYYLQDTFR